MEIKTRPNPNEAFPNPKIPSLCFIKNVVKNPRIIIGDYTYYDDVDGADQFVHKRNRPFCVLALQGLMDAPSNPLLPNPE